MGVDKASIDFEAQDDGYVAKILVDPGTEAKVGDPIMVTVEEEEDIAAFSDFSLADVSPEEPVAEEAAAAEPSPVEPAPTPIPTPTVEVASTPPPVPEPVTASVPEVVPSSPTTVVLSDSGIAWNPLQEIKSPLASSLGASQAAYHELYGPTGHKVMGEEIEA